jgi:hypothetical protein
MQCVTTRPTAAPPLRDIVEVRVASTSGLILIKSRKRITGRDIEQRAVGRVARTPAKFEAEFGDRSQISAATGCLRYTW